MTNDRASCSNRPGWKQVLTSWGVALGLIVATFPGIVIFGGSLAPSNLTPVVDKFGDRSSRNIIYPNLDTRPPRKSYQDLGAAAWQLEPAIHFMRRTLAEGQSPMWNPYSATGMVGPETMVDLKFSPFVLLAALLGASSAAFTFTLLLLITVGLAALQQQLLNHLSASRLAATAGAVVFLLNGFAASYLVNQVAIPYFLFPVVLYPLTNFLIRGRTRDLTLAAVALLALFLSTFLPIVLLVLLGTVTLSTALAADRRVPLAAILRRGTVVPLIAVGLAAFLLVPLAVQLRLSTDIGQYSTRLLEGRSPWQVLSLISPRHLWHTLDFRSHPGSLGGPHWTAWLGLTTIIVLAGGLRFRRDHLRCTAWAAVGLLVAGMGIHLGVPLLRIIGNLPGLRFVRSDYWAAAMAIALTILVPLAIDDLRRLGPRTKSMLGTLILLPSLFIIGFVSLEPLAGVPVVFNALLLGLAVIGCAGLLVLAFFPATRRIGTAGLVLLLYVELLSYLHHGQPARFNVLHDPPRYLQYIQRNLGDGRVLNIGRGGLYPEWGAAAGIPQVSTMLLAQMPDYQRFYRDNLNDRFPPFLQLGRFGDEDSQLNHAAIDLLSVELIVVDRSYRLYLPVFDRRYARVLQKHDIVVYHNPHRFPRAYLSPALAALEKDERLRLDFLRDLTYSDDAPFVELARSVGIPEGPAEPPGSASARILTYRHDRVELETWSDQPSILVLTDAWHPGWRVTVDGEPVHLGRVNGAFRGVVVPEGRSVVVFRYPAVPFRVGSAVSLGVLLLCGTVGAVRHRRRRTAIEIDRNVSEIMR